LREIEILKSLDHPNILKLIEFYEDEQNYFMVTEFIEGKELFDEITSKSNQFYKKFVRIINIRR